MTLTADECRENQSKYAFLKHLSSWRAAMKAAMKRGGSKKTKAVGEEDLVGITDIDVSKVADNAVLAELGRKFGIAVPYASDLVSADYFRLLNMEVPISARPHMARREAFLAEYFSTKGFTAEIGKCTRGVADLVLQRESYPFLPYETGPTDVQTLVPPILLRRNTKHLNAPKFRVEPNASWYLSEMLRIACSVDLRMARRLRSMRPMFSITTSSGGNHFEDGSNQMTEQSAQVANAYAGAVARAAEALGVPPLADNPPDLNIVVLDVFIDIPKQKLADKSR